MQKANGFPLRCRGEIPDIQFCTRELQTTRGKRSATAGAAWAGSTSSEQSSGCARVVNCYSREAIYLQPVYTLAAATATRLSASRISHGLRERDLLIRTQLESRSEPIPVDRVADPRLRLPSGRLTPEAAQSKFESTSGDSVSALNSRVLLRSRRACIRGLPPVVLGSGRMRASSAPGAAEIAVTSRISKILFSINGYSHPNCTANPAQRRRRGRSHSHADAAPGRCGRFQAVQPGKTGHDARGARETGSQGQRASDFAHKEGELKDFMHIYWHTRPLRTTWEKSRGLILKGFFGRAAGI
jgi:hypothetical protein